MTSGPCAAGYYCPPGSDSEQEKPCPIGRYCPMQSKQPILCPVGTYQPNERQVSVEDCLPCTEGKVVMNTDLWNIFHDLREIFRD